MKIPFLSNQGNHSAYNRVDVTLACNSFQIVLTNLSDDSNTTSESSHDLLAGRILS